MNHGSIDLTTEDIERLAAEVWDVAAKEALARGLPVTGYHDGYLFRYQPGKGVEYLAPAPCASDPAATGIDSGSDTQGTVAYSDDRACDTAPMDRTAAPVETIGLRAAIDEFGNDHASAVRDGSPADEAASGVAAPVPAPLAVNGQRATDESLAEIGAKAIEFARQNANATLELTVKLLAAKTFAQVVALATAHAYKQFQALSTQSQARVEHTPESVAEAAVPCKASRPRRRRRKKAATAAGSEASAAP